MTTTLVQNDWKLSICLISKHDEVKYSEFISHFTINDEHVTSILFFFKYFDDTFKLC